MSLRTEPSTGQLQPDVVPAVTGVTEGSFLTWICPGDMALTSGQDNQAKGRSMCKGPEESPPDGLTPICLELRRWKRENSPRGLRINWELVTGLLGTLVPPWAP